MRVAGSQTSGHGYATFLSRCVLLAAVRIRSQLRPTPPQTTLNPCPTGTACRIACALAALAFLPEYLAFLSVLCSAV